MVSFPCLGKLDCRSRRDRQVSLAGQSLWQVWPSGHCELSLRGEPRDLHRPLDMRRDDKIDPAGRDRREATDSRVATITGTHHAEVEELRDERRRQIERAGVLAVHSIFPFVPP